MTVDQIEPFAFLAPSLAAGEGAATLRTPMERAHLRAGATLADEGGWRVARYEGGPAAAWIADVSHAGKVELRGGREALDAAADGLEPGRARRDGDTWTLRLTPRRALVLAPFDRVGEVRDRLGTGALDATSLYAGIALGGERVADVFHRSSALDVRPKAFPPGAVVMGSVMRVPAIVLHAGDEEVLALRILCGWEVGEYLWDALLDAGVTVGLRPATASVALAEGARV